MYKLSKIVVQQMYTHADSCYPQECCGLVGGQQERFISYYPLTNVASEPTRRFFGAPAEMFLVMKQMRSQQQTLLGIYHSHPHSPAYPSASDVEAAYYPEAVNFILSLHPTRTLAAFLIKDGDIIGINYIIE